MSFYLICEIQNHCRELGTLLSINQATLQSIEISYTLYGRERTCSEILNVWMTRGEGENKVTWARLLQAIKNARLEKIAEHLENAFQSSQLILYSCITMFQLVARGAARL